MATVAPRHRGRRRMPVRAEHRGGKGRYAQQVETVGTDRLGLIPIRSGRHHEFLQRSSTRGRAVFRTARRASSGTAMNILHKSLLVLLGCLARAPAQGSALRPGAALEAQMRAVTGAGGAARLRRHRAEGNNPGTMYKETPAPPRHRPRRVKLELDLSTQDRGLSGFADRVSAPLYTADGRFMISMAANLCDSAATADALMENWRAACSAPAREGSVSSDRILGDRSLVINTTVVCRLGACTSPSAAAYRTPAVARDSGRVPPAAVDAVAHAILVRASGMTG